MGIVRKFVSFILMAAAIFALVAVFVGTEDVLQPIADSFSPFEFRAFGYALNGLITGYVGIPLMLFILGFIGMTIPDASKEVL